MLQQTQVDRVRPKFAEFMSRFPTIQALAAAPLSDVLIAWSGLGYNRRAKFLHQAAQRVVQEYDGQLPTTLKELVALPGIGPNTAGALMAYAYNQPVTFIETNIRTVFFHHFFADHTSVSDAELRAVVADMVDEEHPREWYWALMDYGASLKRQGLGVIDKSAHYKKQSPLKGSLREVRGMILKTLSQKPYSLEALQAEMPQDDRFDRALTALLAEGLVVQKGQHLHLP